MPPHLSSELALQTKSVNMPPVCCDHFRLRRPERLPLELNRPSPAAQPDKTALLLGRVASLAMRWAKEWFLLVQNLSGALMTALLMGIAKGAGRPAATAAPLEEAKAPGGGKEEHGGERSKLDGEKLSCKADHHRGHLVQSSLESWSQEEVECLIEEEHAGECRGQFSHGAKMDPMDLEDNPAPWLVCQSMPFDFENDSERSSDEDAGLEDAEYPGSSPQNSLDSLGIKGYFEGSPHEVSEDFKNNLEEDSTVNVDSPSVCQEHRESVEHDSGDFVTFEKQSMESTLDSLEDGKYLTQYGKAPENSYDFQSPLVLSLFFSPSEEDDDDDDSEDWSSDSEMEETSQLYFDGAVLGTGLNSSATGDNSQHQDFPENSCESGSLHTDPLHPLCVSKSIQPTTCAAPEPKQHKEITVSFHLRKAGSKLLCDTPKLSSPKDQRSATGYPPHQCCLLETERNHGSVTAETSLDSQKESQRIKKVRFSPVVTVHRLVVWDYASRAARRGPWEEAARDRCRFQHRIAAVGAILEPCLEAEHRAKAWRKIHGMLDFVRPETANGALHSSAGQEKGTF